MAFEGLNEKLKNLGKKKPDAAGASVRKRGGGVADFFNKNPFMKFLIPVVVLVIITAVFLIALFADGAILGSGSEDGPVPTQPDTTSVAEVVPQAEIVDGTTDDYIAGLMANDPFSEDIIASAQFKGAVIHQNGLRTAIVVNGGVTYTLNVGDKLGASNWSVVEITENAITFSSGTSTKTLSK